MKDKWLRKKLNLSCNQFAQYDMEPLKTLKKFPEQVENSTVDIPSDYFHLCEEVKRQRTDYFHLCEEVKRQRKKIDLLLSYFHLEIIDNSPTRIVPTTRIVKIKLKKGK